MTHASTKFIASISALLATVPIAPASAHPTNWSMAGAACVPTGQTASSVGTFSSAGDVGFPAGKLGEIIVTCPVAATIVTAAFLKMTYRDTDGPGGGVQLIAALRQKSLDNGSVSTVPGAQISSNAFPAVTSTSYVHRNVPIGAPCTSIFKFDHAHFTYYVQVNIRKTNAAAQGLLASVDLANDIIC